MAKTLAARLGLPHVELDAFHHGPNWAEPTAEEFRAGVGEAIAGEGWVVDGNYGTKLRDTVVSRAELIVWLDLPLRSVLRRLWRRTVHRIRDDVELWSGNRETWRGAFLSRDSLFLWVLKTHRRRKREMSALECVRLRSAAEADAWLEGFAPGR